MGEQGAAVVTNAPANNTSNEDRSGCGSARQPRNIPKPSNGNPRGGDGAGGGNARKPSPSRRTATSEVDVVATVEPETTDQRQRVTRSMASQIKSPANGNPRGGHGGQSRSRNNRSMPKIDQVNGQSNQESGSNAQAPNT
jgi:hypothetical protein